MRRWLGVMLENERVGGHLRRNLAVRSFTRHGLAQPFAQPNDKCREYEEVAGKK